MIEMEFLHVHIIFAYYYFIYILIISIRIITSIFVVHMILIPRIILKEKYQHAK